MSRIFISYKRVDKDKVFKLKHQIETATGEKCWVDIDGIESDAQFKNVIIRAINESEIVLFMYSKAHAAITDFEKDWTVRELNFASVKNKRIVFVNLDGTPLTDEFSFDYGLKQQVDGRSSQAVAKLIADMGKWLKISDTQADIGPEVAHHQPNNAELEATEKKPWRKKKGCVVTVSIVAAICAFVVPALWMSNAPQTSSSDSEFIIDSSTHGDNDDVQMLQPDSEEKLLGIDLGLPSHTLWANRNVGAETESDFGNLVPWGDFKLKAPYFENDYVKDSKSCYLAPSDSIRYALDWSTPSDEDFQELIDYCKWQWTARNGHNGYEITGPNGNHIFLPANYDSFEYRKEKGYYWTSQKIDDKLVKVLLFSKSRKRIGNGNLWSGRSIRPVLYHPFRNELLNVKDSSAPK